MNFYITKNNRKIIKKYYYHLIPKGIFFVDVLDIIRRNNLELKTNYDYFLLKHFILNELKIAQRRKKYNSIVYIVENINRQLIYNVRNLLKENNIFILKFGLIDFKQELDSKIYKFFDIII